MPPPACYQIKEELVACIIKSDCILKHDRTITECLQRREELPDRCRHLITSFTDCKRGMLDMRRRFRGNHLSNQEKGDGSGGGSETGGQVSNGTVEVIGEGGRR